VQRWGMCDGGQALFRKGLCIEARPHFERALHFARATPSIDPDGESVAALEWEALVLEWDALVWLGFVATSQGDYDEARTHLAQGLQICQTLGNRRGECRCFIDTGEIAMTVGDYAAASTYFQAALRLANEHGNRWYAGMAHLFLGMVAFAEGNYTLASASTEAARNTFHDIGDPTFGAWALAGFGRLADSVGDYARARDWLEQSLRLSQEAGAWEAQFYGGVFLALVLHHLGEDETACRSAEQSRQIALAAGDRSCQADAWLALGRTHEGLNRLTEAVSSYQQAAALYAALGRAHMTSEPRAGLARIALGQGDLMQAQAQIEAILTFLENHPLIGPDEPGLIYLSCYRVLEATHDPRAAMVLAAAQRSLHANADQIADDVLHRSFLDNVAAHRDLLRAGTGAAAVPVPSFAA
jgi:tetratricopeptide (TPR) repeat protein